MSEVNVRKWHDLIISSQFSSKMGHVKIKLETTYDLDIFTQPVAAYLDRFVSLFVANLANGGPLRLHYGTYGKPLEYKLYCHWLVREYVGSKCRENETTVGYHVKLQQPSSIDVSVTNENV